MSSFAPDGLSKETELACARCKKMFLPMHLHRLKRVPVFIVSLAHLHPGKEADQLYCASCADRLNLCLTILAIIGLLGIAATIFSH